MFALQTTTDLIEQDQTVDDAVVDGRAETPPHHLADEADDNVEAPGQLDINIDNDDDDGVANEDESYPEDLNDDVDNFNNIDDLDARVQDYDQTEHVTDEDAGNNNDELEPQEPEPQAPEPQEPEPQELEPQETEPQETEPQEPESPEPEPLEPDAEFIEPDNSSEEESDDTVTDQQGNSDEQETGDAIVGDDEVRYIYIYNTASIYIVCSIRLNVFNMLLTVGARAFGSLF